MTALTSLDDDRAAALDAAAAVGHIDEAFLARFDHEFPRLHALFTQLYGQRADGRELAEAEAAELVSRLDAAYALRVQQTVAARIRERAASAGFELVSESRDDDDTVTMVLDVKDYA